MAVPGTIRNRVDRSFAARAATGRMDRLRRSDPAAARALAIVADAKHVQIVQLLQANRGMAPVAFARQLAMYLVHILMGRTLTDVGALFGRDRTTVAHACALIEDQREDRAFDQMVEALEQAITTQCVERGEADRAVG